MVMIAMKVIWAQGAGTARAASAGRRAALARGADLFLVDIDAASSKSAAPGTRWRQACRICDLASRRSAMRQASPRGAP
jgi:hypothetical protein